MPGGLWDGGVPEPEDSTWVPVSKGSIRVPLRDLFLGSIEGSLNLRIQGFGFRSLGSACRPT